MTLRRRSVGPASTACAGSLVRADADQDPNDQPQAGRKERQQQMQDVIRRLPSVRSHLVATRAVKAELLDAHAVIVSLTGTVHNAAPTFSTGGK